MCQSVTSNDSMLKIHFTCSISKASSSLLTLLVLTLLTSSTVSIYRTWDSACIDNETITVEKLISNTNNYQVNANLYDLMKRRGSVIPAMLNTKIDSRHGAYNDLYEYCPWAEPLSLTPLKAPGKESVRDVCYSVKIGQQQMDNIFNFDSNKKNNQEFLNEIHKQSIEEVVSEIREFNFGNCMADLNHLIYANFEQMLFTVYQFKFFDPETNGKYNLHTPENLFMVREKMHGTLRDFIDEDLKIDDHPDKQVRDVMMFQMARAVNLIHLRGWVHRDIKPENFYIKKTVDKLVEVRLGEFKGAEMKSSHSVVTDDQEETFGGPFYIPPDAPNHPDDLGNDYYALGASMIELITNKSMEENYTQYKKSVETKLSTHLPEIPELNKAKVTTLEHLEVEMELKKDPILFGIDIENIAQSIELVKERKNEEFDFILNQSDNHVQNVVQSTNFFDVEAFTMNLATVNTPKIDNLTFDRRNRILESGNNSRNERILTKNNQSSYGQNDEDLDLFSIDDQNYNSLNYKPSMNLESKQLFQESLEISDLKVHETEFILNPQISMESINSVILDKEVIKAEHVIENSVFASQNLFKVEETKVTEQLNGQDYVAQKEVDQLVQRMFSLNYFERFIDLRIFGNDISKYQSDPNFQQAQANNITALKFCLKEIQDLSNGSITAKNFIPSTTECLMILLARSIIQSEKSDHYLKMLSAYHYNGPEINSMQDVLKAIVNDRKSAISAQKPISFEQYIQKINQHMLI